MVTTDENKALLEEMLRNAERAPEPGSSEKVVFRGDAETPPMIVDKITSAGYVYLYETDTGERSVANRNMLPALLKIKNPDGNNRFTTVKPDYSPKRGTLKCLLHKDNPNRNHYNELGLPICPKSNITAPYMVEQHMKKRHPSAWATIEKERQDKERQEDRDLQRALLVSATGNFKPEAKEEPKEETKPQPDKRVYKCDKCDFKTDHPLALAGHKRTHK